MGSRIQEVCQAGSHKSSHGLPGCLVLARAGTAGQRSLRELLSPLPGRPAGVCTPGDPRRLQSWRRGHTGLRVRPGAAETDGSLTNTLGHPYHPSSCSPQVHSDLSDLWASVADTGGESSSSPHLEAGGDSSGRDGPSADVQTRASHFSSTAPCRPARDSPRWATAPSSTWKMQLTGPLLSDPHLAPLQAADFLFLRWELP